MSFTSYSVDNDKAFRNAVLEAGKKLKDLRPAFKQISFDFYKSQKAIFNLRGPGQYPDLGGFKPNEKPIGSEKTRRQLAKERKQKIAGFVYPLLSGKNKRIELSTTTSSHTDSINVVEPRSLVIGTKTPYAIYHQSDDPRRKIPLRKFLFIGPEASKYATSEQQGRLERWLGILNAYIKDHLERIGKVE